MSPASPASIGSACGCDCLCWLPPREARRLPIAVCRLRSRRVGRLVSPCWIPRRPAGTSLIRSVRKRLAKSNPPQWVGRRPWGCGWGRLVRYFRLLARGARGALSEPGRLAIHQFTAAAGLDFPATSDRGDLCRRGWQRDAGFADQRHRHRHEAVLERWPRAFHRSQGFGLIARIRGDDVCAGGYRWRRRPGSVCGKLPDTTVAPPGFPF